MSNTVSNGYRPLQKQPFLSEEILSLITEKRSDRARYQLTRLSTHKSAYNKLANSLKRTQAKLKPENHKLKLTKLSSYDGSI